MDPPQDPHSHDPSFVLDSQSPTDTRQPPSRCDTLDRDDLTDNQQSTENMYRRPDQSSYGTLQTPSPSASLPSQQVGDFPSYDRPHVRAGIQPARSPMLGPDRGRTRPRKPPMARRASSNTQAPHRGEFFSTDDDPREVENDAAGRQSYNVDSTRQITATMRRRTIAPPVLSRVQSSGSTDAEDQGMFTRQEEVPSSAPVHPHEEGVLQDISPGSTGTEHADDDDDDDDVSDAESFTLKDRQQAINETHPFGIRIWKPALYKKSRSVLKTAEIDIHSTPGGRVSNWLLFFNIIWTLLFGWWMASFAALGAVVCFIFAAAPSGREYGRVLWGLAGYLFYPFGKFVRLEQDEAYLEEDRGEGRSISEYEQWQNGDLEYGRLFFGPEPRNRSIVGHSRRSIDSEASETDSLLGRSMRHGRLSEGTGRRLKRRLFGRGEWNIGRVIFFVVFWGLITPSLLIVSAICFFLVFWIPMGKVTNLLFSHLRRHPLALSFESDITIARDSDGPQSSILLCTYRAVGSKYWKYTIDGTNIFLINLMAVVIFVVFDWLVLRSALRLENTLTSPGFLFISGLLSIIPLAYFIGQAVASISAQSSMGLGAAINALFSTIVEVFLYCVALKDGKGQLVEGSVIGSIFAGILFLPGLSMCFGAIKRKTQRFNAKSAGVTSTMLLFATVAAFGPTLFYQIYGTQELRCHSCNELDRLERDCRRCYYSQRPALDDRFYIQAVRPYCYMAAVLLFCSYIIGLWFTLRTHAAVIWNIEIDEKKQDDQHHLQAARLAELHHSADASGVDMQNNPLYKRILSQSLKPGNAPGDSENRRSSVPDSAPPNGAIQTPHMVPPKSSGSGSEMNPFHAQMSGHPDSEHGTLVRDAATAAARDRRSSRHISYQIPNVGASSSTPKPTHMRSTDMEDAGEHASHGGGHDAPNWSRMKSSVILMGATVLYAIVAEILVDTVDVVLDRYAIDPKFLGITLFALVPNTTEFLNAISFAMNGNIALSMEIGSAYALQVCLLQIPALVLFSAMYPVTPEGADPSHYIFSLLFPQWDMVTVILCVFLLSYMYGEGKSNYFKGSILLLTYLVVVIGFYFAGLSDDFLDMNTSRFDTLGSDGTWTTYKTIGRRANAPMYEVGVDI